MTVPMLLVYYWPYRHPLYDYIMITYGAEDVIHGLIRYCNKGRGADLSAYHKAIFSFRERKSRDEFSPSLYFSHVNLICIYK